MLINKKLFLKDWVSFYKKKRMYRSVERWYFPESALENLAKKIGAQLNEHGVLTDRSGAHFVDPYASFDTIDILVKNKPSVVEMLESIGAHPVDRGTNINLFEPYYSVSAFYGKQEIKGVQIASNIQIYLDLSHQQKRGLEAAEHLYQQRILPVLEEL